MDLKADDAGMGVAMQGSGPAESGLPVTRSQSVIDEVVAFLLSVGVDIRSDQPEAAWRLVSDGVIDSLLLLQLVTLIESGLGCEIDEGDLTREAFDSLESIIDLVARYNQRRS